jgi:hypothetical protein
MAITFREDDKKAWVRYARHLRRVWSWLPQRHELLEKIVKHVRSSDFMTAADRKAFNKLPPRFTIYRGFQNGARKGFSWTLNREYVAEMFSNLDERFPRGEVIERRVKKSEVFAYISDFDEDEIILQRKT